MALKNKLGFIAGGLIAGLITVAVLAWVPQNTGYNSNQFDTATVGQIAIKSGVTLTNINANGVNTFGSLAAGTIASFSDNNANTMETISDTGVALGNTANLTLSAQTANTFAGFDASKNVVSLSGSAISARLSTNVTSLALPTSGWWIAGVANGTDISNATSISITNTSLAWGFGDGVTNAIRTRFTLYDWDGTDVQLRYEWTCTGTNDVATSKTNIVTGTRIALVGPGNREDSLSFSTLTRMTNGINPTNWFQTVGITRKITPGGTINQTNAFVIELQRLGADTADTCTNATVALIDAVMLYSRTNRIDFLTPSP